MAGILDLRTRRVEDPVGPQVQFYGPHDCAGCGKPICRASFKQGGVAYDYPEGPIYPNTDWNLHDCDMGKVTEPGPMGKSPLVTEPTEIGRAGPS